ncbi:MAG: helix-turn-helix domain-containing protein [Acidimicrobiales bacterium]
MYGDFVRTAREARDLTQAELAQVSGVLQSNISAIEHNRRMPTAQTLNRLIVACGFELTATAGDRVIYCALPRNGWFPDEDVPPRLPDDPSDERPTVGPFTSMDERVRIMTAVLDAADAANSS